MTDDRQLTRRASLGRLGGLLAAAAGGGLWRAADGSAGPSAVASGAVTCVLTPELTEGPYYIAGEKLRRDIRDGKPGMPLTLRLTVLNASTCAPIKGATVEIWHASAGGVYSGFGAGAGNRTFLRGGQKTNASGVAELLTIYPGWYQGRTVHIHVKVHVGGNIVHTGQLFFLDTITDAVFKSSPYNKRGPRDMRNAQDSIFINGGKLSVLHLKKHTGGYTGTIAMGVHRS